MFSFSQCSIKWGGTDKCSLLVPDLTGDLSACYAVTVPACKSRHWHFLRGVGVGEGGCKRMEFKTQSVYTIHAMKLCLVESRICPAQAFCGNSTLTITYSSRTGWVRRMREAYRVVGSTPGVTACSFCPWSPDWRAEWSSTPSPQTAKCQGFLHQNIVLAAAQLVRCKLLCPLSVSLRWALLRMHDKDRLPSL